mmetsp:Transcript_19771/g.37199  ORF Transcript_19771/g.37199 Transcript_19771/m.37199 type:complete len:172 (-) Transcript_19771:195-710(-)
MATLRVCCAIRSWALVAAMIVVAASEDKKLSTEECAELGFASSDLRCSTCTRLREFLPSGEHKGASDSSQLVSECQSCCQAGADEVFKKATLYVCRTQVRDNQDIEDFVKRKASSFKNLKIKYRDGARSLLVFQREGESLEDATERVNIAGWKSDEIRDFVGMKLDVSASS